MEAVREKKPKPKVSRSDVQAPPIPSRSVVVNGLTLPAVPNHAVGTSVIPVLTSEAVSQPIDVSSGNEQEGDRMDSPCPEELEIEDDRVLTPEPEVVVSDETKQETSEFDVNKLIFPKSDNIKKLKLEREIQHNESIVNNVMETPSAPVQLSYPSVPQLSENIDTFPIESYKYKQHTVIENAPLYPEMSLVHFPRNAHGLMIEQELLSYYCNPLYETSDEFVNSFVQANEFPTGPLNSLLIRLKNVADELVVTEIADKENKSSQSTSFANCWSSFMDSGEYKGKCADNRDGFGRVSFPSHTLSKEVHEELQNLVTTNRNILLEKSTSQETVFRSLALQIQWEIIRINSAFMEERGLTVQSHPCLIESEHPSPRRTILLGALSDLFFQLRSPQLPQRFSDAVISWIVELTVVLYMACLPTDALFVLNQILRLPSSVGSWAAALVQTFIGIQSSCSSKTKVDYCLAMLTHLMNPIKARNSFLKLITQSENEDSAWTMLSDDIDEEGDFSLVTINESDLTALLEQLPVQEIYSCAYLHFSSEIKDRTEQFLSMLAFQLILMKILDDGLTTYANPSYKQFCKQIGMSIRKSIHCLSSQWEITRNLVGHHESEQLQREFDRVMILVLQYLISCNSSGLGQFLVDLPYDAVTEDCRKRCEFLLRATCKFTIEDLYDFSMPAITEAIRKGGLKERTERLSNVDAVFIINAISTIVSCSINDPAPFLKEIIEVCFCDETARESLYKVGGEAIATLISKRPGCLDVLLSVLDRNMEHMGQYAINVLSFASLNSCKISEGVLSILGKWLVNKSPGESANRLARRVLSGLFWGYSTTNVLWLNQNIHTICADIVMKAHSVHCGSSNGMIAKSMKQISKMASKMADHEQLFLQFCWDLLIKVKLPVMNSSFSKSHHDLAAYFLDLSQNSMTSVNVFLSDGVGLLNELISSGSSTASVISLSRILFEYHRDIDELSRSKTFLEVFSRVIHVDQCSYAVQWLTGPSSEATPIVRLICSSISFYSKRARNLGSYLRAWVELLCIRGAEGWNSDQVVLQILGTIVRIAFVVDPTNFLGITEQLHAHYTRVIIPTSREKSRGMFALFATAPMSALLIENAYMNVSVFASYMLLLVESLSFPEFYQAIWDYLSKKEKNTMENAVTKASSKCTNFLSLQYCSIYRWAFFLPLCKEKDVLPLALQRMAIDTYTIRQSNGASCQFARKLIGCPGAQHIMDRCKRFLSECPDEKGLVKAISGWLFTSYEVSRKGFDFSVFSLDYLLQMILANETNVWSDFIDFESIGQEDENDVRLFSATCHLQVRDDPSSSSPKIEKFKLTPQSHALPFKTLPAHPNLMAAPTVNSNMAMSYDLVFGLTDPHVSSIHKLADTFGDLGDELEILDSEYMDMILNRFKQTAKNISLNIRCSSTCPHPMNRQITVHPYELDPAVDVQILGNRSKRENTYTSKSDHLINQSAVQTACLEQIARQLAYCYQESHPNMRAAIQNTGRLLFYRIQQSLESSGNSLLFPAASSNFENALRLLGLAFIANHASEQIQVMDKVLNGFVLSDPLVESFTPECLSASELCQAYSSMSAAVRDPERCSRAVKLLSRLSIDKHAVSLPPEQFAPLLSLAFQNLESQQNVDTELHKICFQHVVTFVFHAFPSNFRTGLDLTLQGCLKKAIPKSLLQVYCTKLNAPSWFNPSGEFAIPYSKCPEYISLITHRLTEERGKSRNTLYSTIGIYLEELTSLMQHFVFIPVRECFSPHTPPEVMQEDLLRVFGQIVALWSPLIIPLSKNVPPFSPSHEELVVMVLQKFVELLVALPQNIHLPPTARNIQSLVWQFYFEKMTDLTHGTAFYFSIIESQLMRLNWSAFYPSIHDIQAMDICLSSKSQDCTTFIAQLFVRIPWKDHLERNIRKEVLPTYLSTLFSCLIRITSRDNFYSKVAASLIQELKALSLRSDWNIVTVEEATVLAETVSAVMPYDSLFNATEHVSVLQIIWRKICQFSPKEPFSTTALMKQQLWCKTQCALLLRGGEKNAPPAYNSLIAEVDAVASQHENLRAFTTVSRELLIFWTTISEPVFGESVLNVWNEYLNLKPDSKLVLCCLNTLLSTLKPDQLTTALRVFEKTLVVFFKRIDCSWAKLMEWVQFPASQSSQIFKYLTTCPSNENKVEVLPLTLKTFLDYGRHEDSAFLTVYNYLINIKPKHVQCEASFIALLYRFLTWYSNYCQNLSSKFPINEDILPALLRWLEKSSKDESGFFSNLVKSKKTTHSLKLRAIFTILNNFMAQQSLGEGVKPRTMEGSPVFNSRIQALKDAATQRSFVPFSGAFNTATSYFTQVDIHHMGSAPQLLLRSSQTVFKEKFLSDV